MQQQGKKKSQQQTALADSEEAVFDLLDALLQEVDESTAVAATVTTPLITEEAASLEVVDTASEIETPTQQAALPQWTKQPIHCLLIDVEGTELAIPLVVLSSIAVWDKPALPMPTQPDWHLGVINYRGKNIVIVDTARLIMPEKLVHSAEYRREHHGSHFLIIDDRWALSCDAIKETIELAQDDVKWRPVRPSRPWAVGTLIERLCVLLDTEALKREIEQD